MNMKEEPRTEPQPSSRKISAEPARPGKRRLRHASNTHGAPPPIAKTAQHSHHGAATEASPGNYGRMRSRREVKAEASRRSAFKCLFERATEVMEEKGLLPTFSRLETRQPQTRVEWSSLPPACRIEAALPDNRKARKQVQIENMLMHISHLIRLWQEENRAAICRVVEFCGGAGSLALPLAALYPEIEVWMIENKTASLLIAIARAKEAGLKNLRIYDEDAFTFSAPFTIGVALHACGTLSCNVLDKSLNCGAWGVVICPCCVGKIAAKRTTPLSSLYREWFSESEFKSILKAADWAHTEESAEAEVEVELNEKIRARRICKALVEYDRIQSLLRGGFLSAALCTNVGGVSSPKHDIIVACKAPSNWLHDLPPGYMTTSAPY